MRKLKKNWSQERGEYLTNFDDASAFTTQVFLATWMSREVLEIYFSCMCCWHLWSIKIHLCKMLLYIYSQKSCDCFVVFQVCIIFHYFLCHASLWKPQWLHLVMSDYNVGFTASISSNYSRLQHEHVSQHSQMTCPNVLNKYNCPVYDKDGHLELRSVCINCLCSELTEVIQRCDSCSVLLPHVWAPSWGRLQSEWMDWKGTDTTLSHPVGMWWTCKVIICFRHTTGFTYRGTYTLTVSHIQTMATFVFFLYTLLLKCKNQSAK